MALQKADSMLSNIESASESHKNFLKLCIAGEGVLINSFGLSLDERQNVVNKLLGDIAPGGSYPLSGDLLLIVCDLVKRKKDIFTGVIAINLDALESDHFSGLSLERRFNGYTSGISGLDNVGFGGTMRSAALEEAELDRSYLGTGTGLDFVSQ